MNRFALFLILLCPAVAGPLTAKAQRNITREEYIATYAPIAMEHQKTYGIPASIKMAQGILESQYGNSELSRKSNNHFGIKCKSNWKGDYVTYDDDEKGECFRKYNTVEESYKDHSEFLKAGARYAFLFDLPSDDYKSWAHGLKTAGYATNPRYAYSLIECIENYDLYLLDEGEYPAYIAGVKPVTFIEAVPIKYAEEGLKFEEYTVSVFTAGGHGILVENGVRYIVAGEGDNFRSVAKDLGISEKRLRKYNGKAKPAQLAAGDRVMIENPRRAKR